MYKGILILIKKMIKKYCPAAKNPEKFPLLQENLSSLCGTEKKDLPKMLGRIYHEIQECIKSPACSNAQKEINYTLCQRLKSEIQSWFCELEKSSLPDNVKFEEEDLYRFAGKTMIGVYKGDTMNISKLPPFVQDIAKAGRAYIEQWEMSDECKMVLLTPPKNLLETEEA